MPWFKVDDQLHSHPKPRRASLAAIGLWTMCGSYSMAYKTDGFVPEWFVASFKNGRKLAAELVDAGLWNDAIRSGEVGWQFHDWSDYQPSSDEIEAEREAARERQRAFRQRRRESRAVGDGDASVTALVTRDVTGESQYPVPSRPYPTRPALYRTTRVGPSHHGVAYVTRESGDGMMSGSRWSA